MWDQGDLLGEGYGRLSVPTGHDSDITLTMIPLQSGHLSLPVSSLVKIKFKNKSVKLKRKKKDKANMNCVKLHNAVTLTCNM